MLTQRCETAWGQTGCLDKEATHTDKTITKRLTAKLNEFVMATMEDVTPLTKPRFWIDHETEGTYDGSWCHDCGEIRIVKLRQEAANGA